MSSLDFQHSNMSKKPSAVEIVRARLLRMIEIPYLAKLTIITAPIGYGKTTLAKQWALQGDIPVCWISAKQPGQEPSSTSKRVFREFSDWKASLPPEAGTADASMPLAIILDDIDHNQETEFGQLISDLLLEDQVHIFAISRTPISPTPFGRIASTGQLRLITTNDLRFRNDEIKQLLVRSGIGANEDTEDMINELASRSEGWIAGINLEMQSRIGRPDRTFSHALLDNFVTHDVLATVPDEVKSRLVTTAELPFISEAIWSAMVQPDTDSYSFKNLRFDYPFLEEIDTSTYRHPLLLRESLTRLASILDPANSRERYIDRVVEFLKEAGEYGTALTVATSTKSWEIAIRLAHEICSNYAARDQHDSVVALLDIIPETILIRNDDLAFWFTLALLSNGEIRRGQNVLDLFQDEWARSHDPLRAGRVLVCQALVAIFEGDRESALDAAQRSLTILPGDATLERFRAAATSTVLSAHVGNPVLAKTMFQFTRDYRADLPWDQEWWNVFVMPDQADRIALDGDLISASTLYEHQLATFPDMFKNRSGLIHLRLALIALEQNQLKLAQKHIDAVEKEQSGSYWELEIPLARANIAWAMAEERHAMRIVEDTLHQAYERGSEVQRHRAEALLAQMWIDRGDLALAQAWASRARFSIDEWPRSFGQALPLVVRAHLAIAEGEPDGALPILDRVIDEGIRRQQHGPLVRAYALRALAHARLDNWSGVRDALDSSLTLGKRGAFVRSYFVSRFDVRTLSRDSVQIAESSSRETLTQREIEVLILLNQGMRTRDIALKLSISSLTVKSHLSRIYSKLHVNSRTAALAAARLQKILPHDS